MKDTVPLLTPIELAEKRIFEQAELIDRSIERLQYLRNRFETHTGMGLLKIYRRKKAESSLWVINRQLEEGLKYREVYLRALANNSPRGHLAKMGLIYTVSLEGLKEHVINSFSYNKVYDNYDFQIGEINWKWITEGLIIPELKSYGKNIGDRK
jgi:hypothetical protein